MDDRKQALIAELKRTHAEFLAALAEVPADQQDRPTANPEWPIRDVVAHLASAEPGLQKIIQRVRSGEDIYMPDFDLNRYNARQVEKRQGRSLGDMVAEIQRTRLNTLALLESMNDEELDLVGNHHTFGRVSIEQLFRRVADHEDEHTRDIRGMVS